jgi:hypothetical protein
MPSYCVSKYDLVLHMVILVIAGFSRRMSTVEGGLLPFLPSDFSFQFCCYPSTPSSTFISFNPSLKSEFL